MSRCVAAPAVEARRAEGRGEQLGQGDAAPVVGADTENQRIGPAELRHLVEDLAAAAARSDRSGAGADHRHFGQPAAPAGGHRLGHRHGLGAQRQAVAGVLDVGPGDDLAVLEQQRRADGEVGIGRVGIERRRPRRRHQLVFVVRHGCSTTQRTGSSLASLR